MFTMAKKKKRKTKKKTSDDPTNPNYDPHDVSWINPENPWEYDPEKDEDLPEWVYDRFTMSDDD